MTGNSKKLIDTIHALIAGTHKTMTPEIKALINLMVEYKTKWTTQKRDDLPKSQFAGTDGDSFPIADQEDVKSAWDLRGHDADPEKCGENIKRIAAKLGLKPPEDKEAKDVDIIRFGSSVKALGNGRVGGYLVQFGTPKTKDFDGDYFTAATDYDLDRDTKTSPYYAHGQDSAIKTAKLGLDPFEMKADEVGVWCEGQLNLRNKYEKAIYGLAEKGKLGWSSGTAAHLVERKEIKDDQGVVVATEIVKWPLGLDASLTPTPCDSRTKALALKALSVPKLEDAIKSTGMSMGAQWVILEGAVRSKFGRASVDAYGYSMWPQLISVFDETLVYTLDDGDGDIDYFEAPYTMAGNNVVIGDGIPVVYTDQYVPVDATKSIDKNTKQLGNLTNEVSGEAKDLNSLRFSDHSQSVRTAVKGYAPRVTDYIKTRSEKAKPISPERAEEFKAVKAELLEAVKAIDDALTLTPTPKADEATIKALRFEMLKLQADELGI